MENRAHTNTTRHDTTRHDTHNCALRAAVIGNISGSAYVAEALGRSSKYICRVVAAEDYPGKRFAGYFLRSSLKEKVKTAISYAKTIRKIEESRKKALRKVPSVYFTSPHFDTRSFNMIPQEVFQDIDLFFIACDDHDYEYLSNECKSSDYVSELLSRGIGREKIFIVPPIIYEAELPLLNNDELSPLCKNMNDVKPMLRYLEYHVTDFCNLKCRGCYHMSDYVEGLEFSGSDTLRLSLEKLSEKFRNICTIRLMGGEALLCKNLHEYVDAAHEIFPYSQIKIVTNGLLFKNITSELIQAVKRTGAEIQVTQYPPTRKIAGEIAAFCEKNGMRLRISQPVNDFGRFSFSDKNTGYERCWLNCCQKFCTFLHGTKLYPCPLAWTHSEPRFRDILKENAFTEDESREYSYDLSQEITADGWDMLARLESPMKICRKCGDKIVSFKWESVLPQYNS